MINSQSDAIESLTKENISLKTEVHDLRGSMEDIATRGAQKAIEQLLGQMQQQAAQPQPGQPTVQPLAIAGNILSGISPEIVNKSIEILLARLLPTDQTSDISLFNEKKLAQIGMRYLYLLLNQADTDLRKLEKSVGIKPDSPLHEVV